MYSHVITKVYTQALKRLKNNKKIMGTPKERAMIRKYGRAEDSQERYERFLRWFEQWCGMITFSDITEANILKMDEALASKGMKDAAAWSEANKAEPVGDTTGEGDAAQKNRHRRVLRLCPGVPPIVV